MKLCDWMFVGEMHLGRRSYVLPLKVSCPQICRFDVVIMGCSLTDLIFIFLQIKLLED